jgi:hypothetical protein
MKNNIIITLFASMSLVFAASCKKDRTPGLTTVGVGVNYKTSGSVDTISYAVDSFANLKFGKITMNLDSISKVIYASGNVPTTSTFKNVAITMPDYYWYEEFENEVKVYVSAAGVAERLYGTGTVTDEDTHILPVNPVTGLNMADFVGKGELIFRAKAELVDGTDITEPITLSLASNSTFVFPK